VQHNQLDVTSSPQAMPWLIPASYKQSSDSLALLLQQCATRASLLGRVADPSACTLPSLSQKLPACEKAGLGAVCLNLNGTIFDSSGGELLRVCTAALTNPLAVCVCACVVLSCLPILNVHPTDPHPSFPFLRH
jgi:hypothetical protein